MHFSSAKPWKLAVAVCAVGGGLLLPTLPARGATHTATWIGGEGDWGQAANWSPQTVPQNTQSDQYDVVIDGNGSTISRVYLGMRSPADVTVNSLSLDPDDFLRLENVGFRTRLIAMNGIRIDGSLTVDGATLGVGTNGALTGTGQILCAAGSATFTAAGGSLMIGPGLTVQANGDYYTPHIYVGQAAYPLVNNGTISAAARYTIATISAPTFTNNGTLEVADGATLEIDTTIQQWSDLGTIVNNGGGLVRWLGTLENTGRTFTIPDAFPLELGGTINGGTIAASGGARFVTPIGTTRLNNVTLNAPATINGNLLLGADQSLLGSGDLLLNYGLLQAQSGTFAITDGFLVHGYGTVGSASATLINQTHIVADHSGGTLTVTGDHWINQGVLEVQTGATLAIGGTIRTADLGTIVNNGGSLKLIGTIDNTGHTFKTDPTTNWEIDNGRILGGVVETVPHQDLMMADGASATLDGVTLNGVLHSGNTTGADIFLPHGISGNGTILLNGPYQRILTSLGPDTSPLEIGKGITITGGEAQIGEKSQPVLIHGTVEARDTPPAGTTIFISGSSISIDGTLGIPSGGTMETNTLSFADGGRLSMDLGRSYHRTLLEVTGDLDLSGDDFLDLNPLASDTRFLIATYTGSLTGVFDHVTPGWTVDYSTPNSIYVSIPEPASALLLLGILGCGQTCLRRRRGPGSISVRCL